MKGNGHLLLREYRWIYVFLFHKQEKYDTQDSSGMCHSMPQGHLLGRREEEEEEEQTLVRRGIWMLKKRLKTTLR